MAIAQNEIKAYLVKRDDIDIRQLPKPEEIITALGSITLGDLHGNTLKLLHFLFMHGVIRFKETIKDQYAEYQKFVDAYEAIGKLDLLGNADAETQRDLVEYCAQFTQCLGSLEVCAPNTLVRLIGDELADRGACDYLTLKVLDVLQKAGVRLSILASNHGVEFIEFYEDLCQHGTIGTMGSTLPLPGQKFSLWALRNLLQADGGCSMEELRRLVNAAYLPFLKLLDYELSAQGIRIFTHAPVRFSVIEHVTRKLGVKYTAHSATALAKTIDAINTAFWQRVAQGALSIVFSARITSEVFTIAEQEAHPFTCLVWNRWPENPANRQEALTRPTEYQGYRLAYVHGHDIYDAPPEQVVILDSMLGKGLENSYFGDYLVWNSAEKPSSMQKNPFLKSSARYNVIILMVAAAFLFTFGFSLGSSLVFAELLMPFVIGSVLLNALSFGAVVGVGLALLGLAACFLALRLSEHIRKTPEGGPVQVRPDQKTQQNANQKPEPPLASYTNLFSPTIPKTETSASQVFIDKVPESDEECESDEESEIIIEYSPGNNPFFL